jgi:hypothetical protein
MNAGTPIRVRKLLLVDDDSNVHNQLEISLDDEGATFAVSTNQLDGSAHTRMIHASKIDFIDLVERLSQHRDALQKEIIDS